jgi:hypothetical protein
VQVQVQVQEQMYEKNYQEDKKVEQEEHQKEKCAETWQIRFYHCVQSDLKRSTPAPFDSPPPASRRRGGGPPYRLHPLYHLPILFEQSGKSDLITDISGWVKSP